MEPVSTLIALTSIAVGATVRPRWEPPRIISNEPPRTVIVQPKPVPTNILFAPETTKIDSLPFLSLKDRLLSELALFQPGYPGSDPGIVSNPDDIRTASIFLKSLPAGIPLPTLMRTDDGQIGMYWDIDDIYIDINVDPGRNLSLFSRIRSEGVETFIDAIPLDAINANWAFEHIGVLTQSRAMAA